MTFLDGTEGTATNSERQAGSSAEAGSGTGESGNTMDEAARGDATGDFGGAVGATGSGGPDPFGGAPGSTGRPTLDKLIDRDMARESPTGPGTSTTGADTGPVST